MIISASRRTDIPAFYSEWFYNRIKEGYVLVRNPLNAKQISKVRLDPEVVDCIVFWTKDPKPMMPRLQELSEYCYYFQFTLTGYGRDVEPKLPDKKKVLIPTFQKLSEMIGAERVIWRYDPIAFSERYSMEYHLKAFEQIARELKGCTEKCVISFVDIYDKIQKNIRTLEMKDPADKALYPKEDLTAFAKELSSIASDCGMKIGTCAEVIDLEEAGIEHNKCIDDALIERLTGCKIKIKKDAGQRDACGCVESREIGTHNTCGHCCLYCYANYSPESVKKIMEKYDPASPILCDEMTEEDWKHITEPKQKSFLDRQISLF